MKKKPNILVLITDQQRFDTIQRDHLCQTPHIEALMDRGVNFTKAYTPNAICSPARASLMTGLFPSRHGMVDCTHNVKPYRAELDEQVTMWSHQLEKNGYIGGYFGKWHVERSDQLQHFGYSEYTLEHSEEYVKHRERLGYSDSSFSQPFYLKHKGYKDRLMFGIVDEPLEATEPYFLYTKGIDFIQRQTEQNNPWFTVISTLEPHDPFVAPKECYDRYAVDEIPLPASFNDDISNKPVIFERLRSVWRDLTEQDVKKATACYYASCSLIDDQVGRVVKMLKETSQLEDTVIVYTSDHGELLGAHGLFYKGVPACEEVYHIPMVISGFGVEHPGRHSEAFVNLLDLAPTLVELTGSESLDGIDGKSMLPLLKNDNDDMDRSAWQETFAEFHGQRFAYTQRIVWFDQYKYIFNGFDWDELYDLSNDPYEMNNLASNPDYKEILEDMSKRMWRKVYQLGDYTLGNSDYGMFRFAPIGPDNEDNPYTLQGPASR